MNNHGILSCLYPKKCCLPGAVILAFLFLVAERNLFPYQSVGTIGNFKEISNVQVGQLASSVKAAIKVPESLTDTTLVVVDGEIVSSDILKSMDPDDIESIVVNKNRQMLEQLYGDKTIYGVIQITTKKSH